MMACTTTTTILQRTVKTPKQLYKFLLRSCDKLPKGAQEFYKHSIKQSFKQHVYEPDAERVKQIMEKSLKDAEWVFKKGKFNSEWTNQETVVFPLNVKYSRWLKPIIFEKLP